MSTDFFSIHRRRSRSELATGGAICEQAPIGELVDAFQAGGPELQAVAHGLAADPGEAQDVVDRASARMLERLHCRSDDFAATAALRVLDAASVRLRLLVESCPGASAHPKMADLGASSDARRRRGARSQSSE